MKGEHSTYNATETILAAVNNPAKFIIVTFFVVIAVIILVFSLLFLKFFKLWLQAKLSCAEVKWPELIGMYLRKSDYHTIVMCRIMAVQGGAPLSTRELESHHLAGGRVANVVRALVLAKREGVDLSWKDLTTMDLDSRDVLVEVKARVAGKTRQAVRELKLSFGDIGKALTALRPAGQARFGEMTVDVVTQDRSISKGAQVEVVEVGPGRIVVREIGY